MTTDRPNNRTNYHSHCSFCDGKAPMEDFVVEPAKAVGFGPLGRFVAIPGRGIVFA